MTAEQTESTDGQTELKAIKTFDFHRNGFPWRDIKVFDHDQLVYYSDVSGFKSLPDVTLHKGDKHGPVAGVAYFRWSRDLNLGLGPEERTRAWIKMRNLAGIKQNKYGFEYGDQSYRWERIHSKEDGVKGMMGKMSFYNYKLIEEGSNTVVAKYLETTLERRTGFLEIWTDLSDDLEILVVLTAAGLREKGRRRAVRRSSAASGAAAC